MKAYIFKCKADPMIAGFTVDADGAQLPSDACKGGWGKPQRAELRAGLIGVDVQQAIADIHAQGYHIATGKIEVKISRAPRLK